MTSSSTRTFNSWDAIKIAGLLLMFIDHAGVFFYPDNQWFRAIGRSAAPIFFVLTGLAPTHRFRMDLLLLAVAMTVSNTLVDGKFHALNILVTIILCRALFDWLERKGKRIEHPFHWYIGATVWIFTWLIFQYGTMGLLLAICGYMKRRSAQYSRTLRLNFWLLVFASYFGIHAATNFSVPQNLLMAACVGAVAWWLWELEIRSVRCPRALAALGTWASHYSAYIYALHLIALNWLTGIPF